MEKHLKWGQKYNFAAFDEKVGNTFVAAVANYFKMKLRQSFSFLHSQHD